jgi:hypothetical protein
MTRLLHHIRHNVVAYLALFVALAGTSYAAVAIPNHSINPVKLNRHSIGGYVRAWVSVDGNGRVMASAGGVRVLRDFNFAAGHYIIRWHPRPSSRCTTVGSVDFTGGAVVPGYVITQAFSSRGGGEQSTIQVYNAFGQPAALAYDVALLCATPR